MVPSCSTTNRRLSPAPRSRRPASAARRRPWRARRTPRIAAEAGTVMSARPSAAMAREMRILMFRNLHAMRRDRGMWTRSIRSDDDGLRGLVRGLERRRGGCCRGRPRICATRPPTLGLCERFACGPERAAERGRRPAAALRVPPGHAPGARSARAPGAARPRARWLVARAATGPGARARRRGGQGLRSARRPRVGCAGRPPSLA